MVVGSTAAWVRMWGAGASPPSPTELCRPREKGGEDVPLEALPGLRARGCGGPRAGGWREGRGERALTRPGWAPGLGGVQEGERAEPGSPSERPAAPFPGPGRGAKCAPLLGLGGRPGAVELSLETS